MDELKKCNRGYGTMLTDNFCKSWLSCPGYLNEQVIPDMTDEMSVLSESYDGLAMCMTFELILNNASLSKQNEIELDSNNL